MKILFDANMPGPLDRYLHGHEVVRSHALGWAALKNGVLLDAAERERFDILVTCDQSIPYQQNLAGRRLAIVILSTNRWPRVRRVAPRVAILIDFVKPGQVLRIDIAELLRQLKR